VNQPCVTQNNDCVQLERGLVSSRAKDPIIGHKLMDARWESVGEKTFLSEGLSAPMLSDSDRWIFRMETGRESGASLRPLFD
jgi:hypothetical protein